MLWNEVTKHHHMSKVRVSADSTPDSPVQMIGPIMGYISCPEEDAVPVLLVGKEVWTFAWYYQVEFVQD